MEFYSFFDNSLLQALVYGYLSLAVFISLRILDFPDLTIEGSFPLGASIAATFIYNYDSTFLGILFAIIGGFLSGVVTGILHEYLKLGKLLSGIVVSIGLYSLNFRILSAKANLYISGDKNLLNCLNQINQSLFSSINIAIYPFTNLILIVLLIFIILVIRWFFNSSLGTFIKFSRNDSRNLVESVGANPKLGIIVGLGIANSFAAFAGVLSLFNDGTASISMGFGVILTALAALVIGERIFEYWIKDSTSYNKLLFCPFIGMFIYYLFIGLVRFANVYVQSHWGFPDSNSQLQFFNSDIKFITSLLIVLIYLGRKKERRVLLESL